MALAKARNLSSQSKTPFPRSIHNSCIYLDLSLRVSDHPASINVSHVFLLLFSLTFISFWLWKVFVSAFTGRSLSFFLYTYLPTLSILTLLLLVYDFLSLGACWVFLHEGGSYGVVYPLLWFETVERVHSCGDKKNNKSN